MTVSGTGERLFRLNRKVVVVTLDIHLEIAVCEDLIEGRVQPIFFFARTSYGALIHPWSHETRQSYGSL